MDDIPTTAPKKRSKVGKILIVVTGILFLVLAVGWACFRYIYIPYKFPYGSTHACSKCLGLSLRLYANDHDGWLPYGKQTPEESMGSLAKEDPSVIPLLGGKNIAVEKVKAAFAPGAHFTADLSGWHYNEGLREDDGLQIAVAWDKVVGLNHFGERQSGLMHEIVRLDGSTAYIYKAKWPEFVAMQKRLLDEIIAKRASNAPKIRWSDEATLGPNRFPAPVK